MSQLRHRTSFKAVTTMVVVPTVQAVVAADGAVQNCALRSIRLQAYMTLHANGDLYVY